MRIAILVALAVVLALPALAQIDNGNITGRVTDPSGAVIVGAQVTIVQTEMNFETVATTNGEGIYRALNLRPGPYRLTVVANGFKKLVRENVELRINSTLAVNLPLEVGAVSDSVEVKANAQLLETETSSSGNTLVGDYYYNLPNYQRHTIAVLFFTPGVTFGANQYTKSLGGMTIDGIGSGGMAYFEDGALATMGARGDQVETVTAAVDDIKVFTSAMPAEYGHSAGVGISVVKKTGTNQFHGTLLEQVRTRSMQHRRFFEQYRNSQIQPGFLINPPGLLVQNPDANIRGPVYIPKIYDGRNKTFFSYGFQMMIEKQGKQLNASVPTPEMLSGDFSFTGVAMNGIPVTPNPIYDPVSTRQVDGKWYRDPMPGNIIPRNRWSKVATTFLGFKAIAPPNVPGTWGTTGPSNNVQLGPQKITKWQNHTGRLDHQFTPSLKVYASYTYNHEWGRQPPLAITDPRFDSSNNIGYLDRHTGSLGATWVPSATMVNDFRFSYYGRWSNNSSIVRDKDYATLIGMGGMGLPKTCLPGGIIPTGNAAFMTDQANLSPGCGNGSVQETFTLKDDLSKASGAHNFKMGVEFLRFHLNDKPDPGNVDGTFGYSGVGGLQTSGNGIANTGGFNLASFMFGAINNYSFGYRMNNDLTRSWQTSFYLQDDWKITPTLTANLGIRYNIEPAKHQKYGYISLFDLTIPDNSTYTNQNYAPFCPPGGCLGAYKHPKGALPFPTDYGRIDPVAGLAWHFTPKMVFRAGGRISHLDTFTDNTSLMFSDEMQTQSTGDIRRPSTDYRPLFLLDQGIPAWSYPALRADGSVPYVSTNVGGRGPTIVPNDFKTPYVATWNAAIQRELTTNYVVELRWEGSARVKGYDTYDINGRPRGIIPNPNHDGTMINLEDAANFNYRYQWSTNTIGSYQTNYARPFPNLGAINLVCNCTHSNHQAGIIRLEKRYSKGLNFQVYYTLAKTLSGGPGDNPYIDWRLGKGPSGQKHNFTGTMNYEVPVGKGRRFLTNSNRVLDTIFGGYNISFTYTIASGGLSGAGVSGISVPANTVGGNGTALVNVPQYPNLMPSFGNVLVRRAPKLRDNWQDLGTNRFNRAAQNSMIDCGDPILNGSPLAGNDCATYRRAYSLGNDGGGLWTTQRFIAHSGAIGKEMAIHGERTRLQLRLDWQNPFKWFNWGGPGNSINVQNLTNTLTYGKIDPGNNAETGTGTAGFGGTPLLNLNIALKW